MGCLITSGLGKECQMTVGGIKRLGLGNTSDILSVTRDVDGQVTDIELKPGAQVFNFEFEKNTASLNQALTVAANKYVTPTVAFSIAGYNQTVKNVADLLAIGNVFVLAQFRGDSTWVAGGVVAGLEAATMELNTGAAEGDLEGLIATLTGAETEYAPQITQAAIDLILPDIDAPKVLNVSPVAYSTVGSEAITIDGLNFTGATAVEFIEQTGFTATALASFSVDSDTIITGTTAAMAAETYKIRVTTPDGTDDSDITVVVA